MVDASTLEPLLDRARAAIGATVTATGVTFRVWAPNARRSVAVVLDGDGAREELRREDEGYWVGEIRGIGAGTRYRFSLDGGDPLPDPVSRFQPEGVHDPSEVVDPGAYSWQDGGWRGLSSSNMSIYELHVGAMTPEGTYAALGAQLPALRDLGVTAIELMPLAESPGRWNWGYDGVDIWAPSHNYGTPDDLRSLVDAAHQHGLGVILDVVYNHFGPDGNYLSAYATDYFTDRHMTPWGDAVNYDGENSQPVRDFIIGNAVHWVEEYHIDGLRMDAVHAILDDGPVHVIAELAAAVRIAATPREAVLFAEDERNDVGVMRSPLEGGWGCDGLWADDFHHEMHVFLTGERDGYYGQYEGTLESIAQVITGGFTFQGQEWEPGVNRGTEVTDEPGSAFVFCLQNHDQVGNRAIGNRAHTQMSRERYHVASALFLLVPETPLIWMGQEFRASAPFQYFTDHEGELGRLVTEGRRLEFSHFESFAGAEVPDPQEESTFRDSTLDLSERETNGDTYELYQDLLHLIRDDAVLAVRDRPGTVAVARDDLILLYRTNGKQHRLLLANFGDEVRFPLRNLAEGIPDPPRGVTVLIDTGNERYRGERPTAVADGGVRIPTSTGVLLGW